MVQFGCENGGSVNKLQDLAAKRGLGTPFKMKKPDEEVFSNEISKLPCTLHY